MGNELIFATNQNTSAFSSTIRRRLRLCVCARMFPSKWNEALWNSRNVPIPLQKLGKKYWNPHFRSVWNMTARITGIWSIKRLHDDLFNKRFALFVSTPWHHITFISNKYVNILEIMVELALVFTKLAAATAVVAVVIVLVKSLRYVVPSLG